MLRALLVTTAAMVCLCMAFGCNHERELPYSPRHSEQRTTIIHGSPPATRASDPASGAIPKSVTPEPAMSTPPVETVVDTPAPEPARAPAPLPRTPRRDASPYRDGCGRPLVA
jgi:hypothetical protein